MHFDRAVEKCDPIIIQKMAEGIGGVSGGCISGTSLLFCGAFE